MWLLFFFQAEDGIRDLVRSRGLGDVYKRQDLGVVGGGHQADVHGNLSHVCVEILPEKCAQENELSLIHI